MSNKKEERRAARQRRKNNSKNNSKKGSNGFADLEKVTPLDDAYLAEVEEKRKAEKAYRIRNVAELAKKIESDSIGIDGIEGFIQMMRRCKVIVETAETMTDSETAKYQAEFDVAVVKFEKLAEIPDDKEAAKELVQLKNRCDWLASLLNEQQTHACYYEMMSQATARRSKGFSKGSRIVTDLQTIDNIRAVAGFVVITETDGNVINLTVQDAAVRAEAINQMIGAAPTEWHYSRWNKLIELLKDACLQAKQQRMDTTDSRTKLLREVFEGVDEQGNAKPVIVDARMVSNTLKLFPSLTEDEVVVVLTDRTKNLTMQQKDVMLRHIHEERCFDKGTDPTAGQDMNLE